MDFLFPERKIYVMNFFVNGIFILLEHISIEIWDIFLFDFLSLDCCYVNNRIDHRISTHNGPLHLFSACI